MSRGECPICHESIVDEGESQQVCSGCGNILEEGRIVCEAEYTGDGDTAGQAHTQHRQLSKAAGKARRTIDALGQMPTVNLSKDDREVAKVLYDRMLESNCMMKPMEMLAACCVYEQCRNTVSMEIFAAECEQCQSRSDSKGKLPKYKFAQWWKQFKNYARKLGCLKTVKVRGHMSSLELAASKISDHVGFSATERRKAVTMIKTVAAIVHKIAEEYEIGTGRNPHFLVGASTILAVQAHAAARTDRLDWDGIPADIESVAKRLGLAKDSLRSQTMELKRAFVTLAAESELTYCTEVEVADHLFDILKHKEVLGEMLRDRDGQFDIGPAASTMTNKIGDDKYVKDAKKRTEVLHTAKRRRLEKQKESDHVIPAPRKSSEVIQDEVVCCEMLLDAGMSDEQIMHVPDLLTHELVVPGKQVTRSESLDDKDIEADIPGIDFSRYLREEGEVVQTPMTMP